MSVLQRIARPILQASARRCMSSHGDHYEGTWEKPGFEVLPVPEGSWQEDFDKKNAYGNKVLAVGIIAFTAASLHALSDTAQPVLKSDFPLDPSKPLNG